MQHLQYPVLGSSEEIESEFESKWLDDFGCIHCHNFSDWSLTVLTYSVLVVSLGSSLSFASLDLNPLSHSSPWNGKFWLKSFGPLGSSSRRLNPFAKTWLTLPLPISHWPVSWWEFSLWNKTSIHKISSALIAMKISIMAHSCICSNICGAKLVFMAVINFRAPSPHLTLSLLLLLPLLPTVFTTVILWQCTMG